MKIHLLELFLLFGWLSTASVFVCYLDCMQTYFYFCLGPEHLQHVKCSISHGMVAQVQDSHNYTPKPIPNVIMAWSIPCSVSFNIRWEPVDEAVKHEGRRWYQNPVLLLFVAVFRLPDDAETSHTKTPSYVLYLNNLPGDPKKKNIHLSVDLWRLLGDQNLYL